MEINLSMPIFPLYPISGSSFGAEDRGSGVVEEAFLSGLMSKLQGEMIFSIT